MAYSLVIADDEQMMRNGLKNIVNWKELGFEISGIFTDGSEVITYLEQNIPNVILADIKMLSVSGLDILEFVHVNKIPVKVVLLSGYNDFEYARRAVEYKAEHYLLKPISISKLKEIFTEFRISLDEQANLDRRIQNQIEHRNRLVNYEKHQFLLDIYLGVSDNSQKIKQRMELLDIHEESTLKCILVDIKIKDDDNLKRFLEEYGGDELVEMLNNMLQAFDTEIDFYLLEYHDCCLKGLFTEKQIGVIDKYKQKEFLGKMIYSLLKQMSGLSAQVSEIKYFDNLKVIFQYFKSIQQSSLLVDEKNISNCIYRIQQFIQNNYEKNITLADASELVYLNPVYISRIFKEQTGKTFTEYLTDVRINSAASYLENSNHYVYEIGEMVGYQNLKYFYKIFKKVKGCSPSDYKVAKSRKEGISNETSI